MREGTRNFFVGLASILALVSLAALLMSFGELDAFFNPRYTLTINTNNASGLRAGSSIEFNGVPIGLIEEVEAQSDPRFPVRLKAGIEDGVKLPIDVQPFVSMPLIGATAILQLRPQSENAQGFLPDDDTAEITAALKGGMFAEITEQLDQRMKPLMESLDHFNKLSQTFVTLGENLNSMLLPQSSQELSQGADPNLRTAVVRLNVALEQAQQGLQLANSFLGDEQLRSDARHAVHQAKALIDEASTAIQNYSRLATTMESSSEKLMEKLLPVMDTLGVTLEEVRRVAQQANTGQGTVGQLLQNPDLYKSLSDAATRLDRTLIELQLLIQQLRNEGFIIGF